MEFFEVSLMYWLYSGMMSGWIGFWRDLVPV